MSAAAAGPAAGPAYGEAHGPAYSGAAPSTRGPRSRRLAYAGCAVVATCCAIAYVVDPQGVGLVAFGTANLLLIVAITVGPLLRGVRPRRIWAVETFAGVCLLPSLLGQFVTLDIGPIGFTDLTYFSGYLMLVAWLALLSRYVGPRGEHSTVLDTASATVGAALGLWAVALAPLVGAAGLPSGLVWVVYPTFDVILLAQAVHLALRLRTVPTALRWFMWSLGLQLVLDCIYSVSEALAPRGDDPALLACYLFSFLGMALSATHPSVVELSRRPVDVPPRPQAGRSTALVVFTISPAILSTAIPVTGRVDIVVRIALVTVLLGLLFVRLRRTMTALSFAEADSHHRATHDELTGLLNRAALLDAIGRRLVNDAAGGRATAVLFFDCDKFKHVNDTWGHRAGDNLLRDIAVRLPDRLGPADLLARHGGDEFAVLASVETLDEAVALAEEVRRFFTQPVAILPGRGHVVSTSIGVALARPADGVTTDDLLARADAAMYEAKHAGPGGVVVFGDDLARRAGMRAAVGDRLSEAIEREAFDVALQPIMGGPDYGTLVGWEALARWRDPDLGEVPPDVFVPLAEQLGLICDLGAVILRRACRELAAIRHALADDHVSIHVNVSPAQLTQAEFVDVVADAIRSAGLPSDCLRLEVTERLLVGEGPTVLGTLAQLRDTGTRICIDDFGTGYASLATLLRLPVDCVKLDKSLVARVGADADAARQLHAVIDLVNSLGIHRVVAEGVETAEQEATLRALGCPMVQGWWYGAPMTVTDVLARASSGARAAAGGRARADGGSQ